MSETTKYAWDPAKDAINRRKHGIGFDAMERFDWEFAFGPQLQYIDGEEREFWLGPVGGCLFALTLTMRGDIMRIISLRDASRQEKRRWREHFHE